MLAVDRQKTRPALLHRVHKQTSTGHQRLFVGQQNIFTRIYCRKRRQQPGRTDNGRHDLVNLIQRRHVAGRLRPTQHLGSTALLKQQSFQLTRALIVIHNRITWHKLQALLDHALHVLTGDQRGHGIMFRIVADDVESTATDRAG